MSMDMEERFHEIYAHDVDFWFQLIGKYRMEGNPTIDECEACGEDFGESGETAAGWNSECVSCGYDVYETKPTDREHFKDWVIKRLSEDGARGQDG